MPESVTQIVPPQVIYQIGKQKPYQFVNEAFEFVVTESLVERSTHKFVLLDPFFDRFDFQNTERDVFFQFGWTGGPLSEVRSAILCDYDVDLGGVGSTINFTSSDKSIDLMLGQRNIGYSNLTISDIVRRIALLNNMVADVEETDGTYSLLQCWRSDFSFIKTELTPRAISKKTGQGDYYCFVDHLGVLHFHTPRYNNKVFKKYTYASNTNTKVIKEIKFGFRGQVTNMLGGVSVQSFGYEPIQKLKIEEFANNPTTLEKEVFGSKTDLLDSNLKNSVGGRYTHATQGINPTQIRNEAKARYYKAQMSRYWGYLKVVGDPLLLPGVVISIAVPIRNGGYHPFSGRYLVVETRHRITNTEYYTELILARNGILQGKDDLVGVKREETQEEGFGVFEKVATQL